MHTALGALGVTGRCDISVSGCRPLRESSRARAISRHCLARTTVANHDADSRSIHPMKFNIPASAAASQYDRSVLRSCARAVAKASKDNEGQRGTIAAPSFRGRQCWVDGSAQPGKPLAQGWRGPLRRRDVHVFARATSKRGVSPFTQPFFRCLAVVPA